MVTVDVFTSGYNEEIVLPHFIAHYKQFCRNITFSNNCSTDRSVEICKDSGVTVVDTGMDELNDYGLIEIKSSCYRQSDADFVIVVDPDEFVYHPDLLKLLEYYKSNGITLPKVRGYTMATLAGYPKNDLLINTVKTGIPAAQYGKYCILNPVLDVYWDVGAHSMVRCLGPVKESDQADITLYHYKFVDKEEVHTKKKVYSERMSPINKRDNLAATYFSYDYEETESWFNGHVNASMKVL